jgi:hypothetical protein
VAPPDPAGQPVGMVSVEDYLWYVDAALRSMVAIVSELGDDLANRRPDLPGANSPYAILTHCLGVVEWWGGRVIADREVQRDRPSEFVAAGPVAELLQRADSVRAQLAVDLAGVEPPAPPSGPVDEEDAATPVGRTQGGVLLHIYEELSQHLGQMEVSRDVLRAPWVRLAP